MLSSEQFFQQLRSALNHLYDPYYLNKSPLADALGLGGRPDAAAALQRILNEGIAALEPSPDAPDAAQRRKSYELILYRYVQQFAQEEIANQMGMSVRHLRREQNAAVYTLAALLWEKFALGGRPFQVDDLEAEEPTTSQAPTPAPEGEDLGWLRELPAAGQGALGEVLPAVLALARPLAERYQVDVRILPPAPAQGQASAPTPLPPLALQEVALRQLLLNALSVAIRAHAGGQVTIRAGLSEGQAAVWLAGGEEPACRPLSDDDHASLRIAARIAEYYGGSLRYAPGPGPCRVEALLPVFRTRTVLVVDDNIDFHQLVSRSLTGAPYLVTGERDPRLAVETALQTAPDAILLDVMMPGLDGWEVLGRLRRHPRTAHIPVIVCTILPQEELALSLGASGFLRKPVNPEGILSALYRLAVSPEPGSR
jgi:CheY-like chemotaxis protein